MPEVFSSALHENIISEFQNIDKYGIKFAKLCFQKKTTFDFCLLDIWHNFEYMG